jgi:hypothetical protein
VAEKTGNEAMNMNIFFIVLLCFTGITGCGPTLTEIRTSIPDSIVESSMSAKSIANCLYYEAQAENDNIWAPAWNIVEISDQNGAYYLTLSGSGSMFIKTHVPGGEITVKPKGEGGSIIEVRSHARMVKARILEYIEKCKLKQQKNGQEKY